MAKKIWKYMTMTAPHALWSKMKNNGFKIMKILTNAE